MGDKKPSYVDFVRFQSQKNPCLTDLTEILGRKPRNGASTSTITRLDYSCDGGLPPLTQSPKVADADVSKLLSTNRALPGRILFIENIQPSLVSALGEAMDIDPLFFAGHITTDFSGIEIAPPPPSLALFPSQLTESGYLHVHFQQVIDLGSADLFKDCGYALKTDSANPRNVRHLPDISGRQLALARACCSVLVKHIKNEWICLVLVDAPIRAIFGTLKSGARKRFTCKPLQGGFVDFEQPTSFSSFQHTTQNDGSWDKTSMLATLLHYFRHGSQDLGPAQDQTVSLIPPEDGHSKRPAPSILRLSYYPVRLALAEWMLYTHLMSRYVKHYEYSLRHDKNRLHDSDLVDLQRWRRRSKQTQHKLLLLSQFIQFWLPREIDNKQRWHRILSDISHVHSEVEHYNSSLQQMVPVATSMVQLRDAANITRLTYIALVFVPLSWVASLFSMAENFAPGQRWFWMYFATAVPLVLVLLLPLQRDRLVKWVKRMRRLWRRRVAEERIIEGEAA